MTDRFRSWCNREGALPHPDRWECPYQDHCPLGRCAAGMDKLELVEAYELPEEVGQDILDEINDIAHAKYINRLMEVIDDPEFKDWPLLICSDAIYYPPGAKCKNVVGIFKEAIKIIKIHFKNKEPE